MTAAQDDTLPQRVANRPAVDRGAHARMQRLEARVEITESHLHGVPGDEGIKSRLARLEEKIDGFGQRVHGQVEGVHQHLDRVVKALNASRDPAWFWPLVAGCVVGALGVFLLGAALAAKQRGLW